MFRSRTKPIKVKLTAQALVEFALALPILMLVIYGLVESGRLLFIYASVVSAARQAVRYGAATGVNAAGTPYYDDCDGIRAAARKLGFIQSFSSIEIMHDDAPITTFNDLLAHHVYCTGSTDTADYQNGQRIAVRVSADYTPIVPLVPFQGFTITAQSARTVLVSVAIGVPTPPPPGSSVLYLIKTPNKETFSYKGEVITYTYTLTNLGTPDLHKPYAVTDDKIASVDCSVANAHGTLVGGTSTTCTATYTITQDDLDAGEVTNNAVATSDDGVVVSQGVGTAVINADQNPQLTLQKSANPTNITTSGTTITYTYTLKNTGNVTLTSPYTVTDNLIASVNCGGAASSIAPGASTTCTGTYTSTPEDLTNGQIKNTATATATLGSYTVTSNQASAVVLTKKLILSITPSPSSVSSVGQVITYTYSLHNASSSNFTSPYTVTDDKVTNISCSSAVSPLAPGGTTSCTGTYTVTQADLDAGSITNTATATATSGTATETSAATDGYVVVVQTPEALLTITPSPTTATALGQKIAYSYSFENTGNVTLLGPFSISDDRITSTDCSAAASTLAPGDSTLCTGTYSVQQSDIDAGSIVDHATVSGTKPGGIAVTSAAASATVVTYDAPRMSLNKSANPTSATTIGQVITYTYTLKNTGNTPLTDISVSDNKVPSVDVDCSAAVVPIPVGGSATCTGTYSIILADLNAGSLTNTATASAMAGTQNVTSNQTSATVTTAFICDVKHSGSLPTGATQNWTIFNNTSVTLHIATITISGGSSSAKLTTVKMGGSTIWTGSNDASGGLTIPGGPWAFAPGSTTIQLTFSSSTGGARIVVTFSEPACSSPLDSGNSAQIQPGVGTCSPVDATINAPFTYEGAGSFCWKTNSLGSYINSWNLQQLIINNVDETNKYISSSNYPPQIGGYWYIYFVGPYNWSHFETK